MVRIYFSKNTEIRFLDLESNNLQWYNCSYRRASCMEVADILFATAFVVYVKCLDGETAILDISSIGGIEVCHEHPAGYGK